MVPNPSPTDVDASDDLDAPGRIDTHCLPAGGRRVGGSNPVAPTTRKPPSGSPVNAAFAVRLAAVLASFQMLPEQPADELLDSIRIADGLGYHGCYSADEIYHKDAWMLLAGAARQTERVRLGPCVAPPSSCATRSTSRSSPRLSTS